MWKLVLVVALVGATSLAGEPPKEEPQTYDAAYEQAQKEGKPLVVLVGAQWCQACQVMKTGTIEPMKDSGELKDVIYTHVDKDANPELATQLMKGSTLPQVVVFAKSPSGWKRLSATGIQSRGRMQEMVRRAVSIIGLQNN